MANTFSMVTADAVYSYTNSFGPDKNQAVSFQIRNNMKRADTQNYLPKVQKGNHRIVAKVILADSEDNFEANVYPLQTHPSDLTVTFDRNIPTRSTTVGTFVLVDLVIIKEFDDGVNKEIEITLIEKPAAP